MLLFQTAFIVGFYLLHPTHRPKNAARPRAQTGWKSILERVFTKRLCHRFWAPILWCDFLWTEKDIVYQAWRFNKKKIIHNLVRSSDCLLYSALMIFRVVNNASLKCIARWYYLFTMFLFICGHCVSYIHVFIMITNKRAKYTSCFRSHSNLFIWKK